MLRRTVVFTSIAFCGAAVLPHVAVAQPATRPAAGPERDPGNSPAVTRMMSFDKNGDGKVTREELADERLVRMFDRADADKDGAVTKSEMTALAARMEEEGGGPGGPGGGRRGPGGGGGGGFGGGGPGGRGRGPGGPGPGQVLPGFMQDQLNLTPEQKKQVADLQSEVDHKLASILTEEQKRQLNEMRSRGPGRGGPGGPGGPGGGPEGGPGGGPGGERGRRPEGGPPPAE